MYFGFDEIKAFRTCRKLYFKFECLLLICFHLVWLILFLFSVPKPSPHFSQFQTGGMKKKKKVSRATSRIKKCRNKWKNKYSLWWIGTFLYFYNYSFISTFLYFFISKNISLNTEMNKNVEKIDFSINK